MEKNQSEEYSQDFQKKKESGNFQPLNAAHKKTVKRKTTPNFPES